MSIALHVAHDRPFALAEAEGVLTFAELQQHLDEELRAGAMPYPELFDATQATTDLTAAEIRALVDQVRTLQREVPVGPCAVVTVNDPLFGMARMFQVLAEPAGIVLGVFRARWEAEEWLARGAPPQG